MSTPASPRSAARRTSRLLPVATALAGATLTATAVVGAGPAALAAGGTAPYQLTRALDVLTGSTQVVRWAPCAVYGGRTHAQVIDYKVNPAGHSGRIHLVKRAVRRLHHATGLDFHYAGRTHYIPRARLGVLQAGDMEQHTGVPLVIAWAKEGTGSLASNLLTGLEQGVGTITWASSPVSALRINDAAVVMKRGQHLASGFRAGGSIGTLLQHELGHAVGLQHVEDPTQIMNPFLGRSAPDNYAAGDRAGLRKVGASQGCLKGKRIAPSGA